MPSNYGLDPLEALRRTRLANKRSREVAQHAEDLRYRNDTLSNRLDYRAAMIERYQDLARTTGGYIIDLSHGNTVTGFTNSSETELEMLAAHLLGITDLFCDPHQYWKQKYKIVKALSEKQHKAINLRMLCRMEWMEWCQQVDVLAKFGAAVIDAFIHKNNEHIRSKALLCFFTKASERYHSLRTQAMNLRTGDKIRAEFESTRYDFWKDTIRFKRHDDGVICPNANLTLEANPDISLDNYLIGGQITHEFGINIRTLRKDVCFKTELSHSRSSGIKDWNLGCCYV